MATRSEHSPTTAGIGSEARAHLEHAVEEAARLLNVDGAMVYLVDPAEGRMRFEVDAGIRSPEARELIRDLALPIGVGIFGTAVERRETVVTDDYRRDKRFPHSPIADRIVTIVNMRSMMAAPLVADGEVLGALGAYSSSLGGFGEADVALLQSLADHAASAIWKLRLIERLNASQDELAQLVDAQRTLGQIGTRITAITESGEVLQQIVDAARRLLGSDGAHLTTLDEAAEVLRPSVIAGGLDEDTHEWMHGLEFPLGGGINGLAAANGEVTWTGDYLIDERIPHEPSDHLVAERMGLRAMAAAPLRGPEGRTIGTLAVSYVEPREFAPGELQLLQGLADQGAIAISNARLYEQLRASEERYRFLTDASPDIMWSTDTQGRFTYISDTVERLTGWRPDEVVGRHFSFLTAPESLPQVEAAWQQLVANPAGHLRARFLLPRKDGSTMPAEVRAMGTVDEDGVLRGGHGATTDMTEIDRLEQDLRRQTERLERRVEAQRALAEIAVEITSLRDPKSVVQRALSEAVRLMEADGGRVGLLDQGMEGDLRWAYVRTSDGEVLASGDAEEAQPNNAPADTGVAGLALGERRVVVTGDYLADESFAHDADADGFIREAGIKSVVAAPLIGERGPIGCLIVDARRADAFSAEDGELLGALAAQAAISVENARLYDASTALADALGHRVEAQRALAEIAAEITSLRDPAAVLRRAVDEAARLLQADQALIHQLLPDSDQLADFRSVADAPDAPPDASTVTVRVGQGIAGRAISSSEVTWTGDYLGDESFEHTEVADAWIRERGFASQMSAPLVTESGPVGALTVYSTRTSAFDAESAELLGALASHAAIVLTNARLYRETRQAAEELERRVEAQRTVGAIATRITAIRDPADVLQQTLNEAVRLLDGDGGRIELIDAGTGGLHWAFGHSAIDLPIERDEINDPVQADEGVSGQAVIQRRVVWTGDYLADEAFMHAEGPDRYVRQHGIRSVIAAPLIGELGPLGSITIHSPTRDAFDESDAELLGILATQAAIALTNARLYDELRERVDAQRALAGISAEIAALRDPAAVIQRTADEAHRLLRADASLINPVASPETLLGMPIAAAGMGDEIDDVEVPMGRGVSGLAVSERRVVRTGDYLADASFEHVEEVDAYVRRRGMRSIMSAPLLDSQGPLGVLTVQSSLPDAFSEADAELLGILADQAAIALTNARLYDALRERVDAQRALAEIAAEITSLRSPETVIQRAVADAARLLRADRAQVNLVAESGTELDPPIAAAPTPPSPDDVPVPIGSGIAGMAAADRRVFWTGDYLTDRSFTHDPGDALIDERGIHSMMSAPLIGPDGLLGTITVQSSERDRFDDEDAGLLRLLADQAAIALINAQLYDDLQGSERRYRFLVDNSPDIVWSVDGDGRFTFFSESLEERTGWKAEQLLGQHFSVITGTEHDAEVRAIFDHLRQHPSDDQRIRLELPLPDGGTSSAEITMVGTTQDGRFSGAHGSVRDISEREQLERDLRRQAADLAAGEERAHLARELHDSVTQALFSMGLTMRSLELLLEEDPAKAREKLGELRELQRDALAEMRTLIFELRPASLEKDGLAQAIRNHAAAVQGRTGLALSVEIDDIERLPIETEEAIYRIAQESLHNIVKHAGPSAAELRLVQQRGRVRLVVKDDGAGFDPSSVPRGHLGLVGMQQRADRAGLSLKVTSRPGRGTRIEVVAPAAEPVAPPEAASVK